MCLQVWVVCSPDIPPFLALLAHECLLTIFGSAPAHCCPRVFRVFGKLGFDEGVAGHLTVRDPILKDHFCTLRLYCSHILLWPLLPPLQLS
jgi:hypothetical protein